MGSAASGFWGLGRAIWPSGRKLEGGQGQAKASGPLGWGEYEGALFEGCEGTSGGCVVMISCKPLGPYKFNSLVLLSKCMVFNKPINPK